MKQYLRDFYGRITLPPVNIQHANDGKQALNSVHETERQENPVAIVIWEEVTRITNTANCTRAVSIQGAGTDTDDCGGGR